MPTGSAAVLIEGYTIHALMFLPKHQQSIKQHQLELIWRTMDFLILDEASLISAKLLSQVCQRISQAKSWNDSVKDKPFGGVNMIFAGNIGQSHPPKSSATYSYKLVKELTPSTSHTI